MSDPTPAAPDPQPRVCSNCGAVLGPKETGHFVPPSVGESGFYYCRGAAPDQAEGPDENRGDDVPSVTSRVEESVMDKGVFRYDTDKTRLGAPLVPWDPSHREIL